MRTATFVVFFALAASCLDLSVPPRPGPPAPGALSGRVMAVPIGQAGRLEPVRGARVELLGTGLVTTSDENGFFRLGGIVREARQALFRADLSGDGRADRSKLITLDAVRVGPGRQVTLPDVVLAESASLRGRVLRGDVPTDRGHAGTLVFVPEGPFTSTSSDDGSFTFDDLPEGTLSLAFFRAGYRPNGFSSVTLLSGEERALRTVTLEVDPTVPAPVGIAGRIRLPSGAPAAGATVIAASPTTMKSAVTADDGAFEVTELPPGVYSVSASREDAAVARVSNVLVTSGRVTLPDIVLGPPPMMGAGGGSAGGFVEGPGGGTAGGAAGGSAGGAAGGSAGGVAGGSAGGIAGGSAGGVAGGSAGGAAGGSAGGVAGGSAGGAAGGSAGGVAGGTAGGVAGGSAGGVAGGSAGGSVVPMPPAPPLNVTAIPGNTQVTLTFSPSPGATAYRAYWANQAPVTTASTTLGAVTSPTLHQGLTNGTTYFYVVTALNAAGESAPSAVVQATPLAFASSATPEVLSRRPDVGATSVRVGSRVDVRVDRDLDGTTATDAVVRLTLLDGGVVPISVSSAGPTLSITPMSPLAFETSYRVTLGTGLRSATGQALASEDTWAFTTSSPPPGLSAFLGSGANQLTWTSVRDARAYLVTRSGTGLVTPRRFTVDGNAFTDTGLFDGSEYVYTVQAVTPFGLSPPSNEVRLRPSPARPGPPTTVDVFTGATTAVLSWSSVSNVTGYSIFRGPAAGGPFTLVTSGWPSTTYVDTGRAPDAPVAYVVQAEGLTGVSVYSQPAVASTRSQSLPAPAGLVATAGDSLVRLSWTAVPGAAGYVVFSALFPNGAPTRIGWVTDRTTFDVNQVNNGETYRFLVAASVDGFLGDVAEALASPAPGLPLVPPVRLLSATVGVNSVTLLAEAARVGTLEFLRAPTPDGGFQPVSGSSVALDGGTTWFFAARAVSGTRASELSNVVEATPVPFGVPPAPQNVTALAATQGAEVSWSVTPFASSYEVGRATSPGTGPYSQVCATSDPLNTRCAPNLTDNQLVFLAVRAVNGATPGPWSAEVAVRPTNLPPSAGLPRPSVSVDEGNGTMTLWWNLVPAATEYRVFRRTRTTPWALHRTTSLLGFEEAVPNGLEVQYGVLAAAPAASRFSVMTVTNFVQASAARPFRLTNVQVVPHDGSATVSWAPVAGLTTVRAAASVLPGSAPAGSQARCSSDGLEPCELTLPNGTPYVIAVQATAPGNLTSSWTQEVTVTPNVGAPSEPTGLSITPGNGTLSLEAVGVAGASFRLLRRTESTPYAEVNTAPAPFFEESVTNGVRTLYLLQQTTAQGTSPWTTRRADSASHLVAQAPSITSVVPGNGELALQWTRVFGVAGYRVFTSSTLVGPFTLATTTQGDESTRTTVQTPGSSVRFVAVRTLDSIGNLGSRSAVVSGTPSSAALDAPTATRLVGNQGIEVYWNDVPGALGYQVSRRVAGGEDWRPVASLTGRRLVDQNVEPGESFVYAVQTVGPQGPGPWSLSAVTTAAANEPPLVRNVAVRPGNGGALVEWAPVAGVSGYVVRTDSSPTGAFSATACNLQTGPFETRCRVSGSNGTPLFVVVSATVAGQWGPGTPSPLTTTPEAARPTTPSFSLTGAGAGRLQLTISTVSGATGYRIFRRTDTTPYTLVTTTPTTTWVDQGLTPGTRYWYQVEAENAVGPGAPSPSSSQLAP